MKSSRPRERRATSVARVRRRVFDFTEYLVEIKEWDWSFSFGLADPRWEPKAYSDYRHLQIRGTLLYPVRMRGPAVELTLLPDAKMDKEDWPDGAPLGVGSLRVNHKLNRLLQGLLSCPADALAPILTMLTAGQFKFVVLNGSPIRHRNAQITNYRLEIRYDHDEFPADA